MVKFEYIEHLWWLLLLVPISLAFISYVFWRDKAKARLGSQALVNQLMPLSSERKYIIKFVLLFLAVTSMVIAYANPQIGKKFEKVQRKGIDVIIAIDVSRSMLAEDIKPDRIQRSKQFVSNLIDQLKNDRIGLIVFAGNAYLQMPLTSDKASAKLFLNTINTNMVPTQGTAIGDAISMALQSFDENEQKYKSLIIITDGEDHEGEVFEKAEDAASKGVVIHTLGMGDPKGAPIPVKLNGSPDFKRDNDGNIVLSKLNENMLQQIAAKGNGTYYRFVSGKEELDGILAALNTMDKKEFDEQIITDYEDQFQWFVLLALILLTLEFVISEQKSLWLRNLALLSNSKEKNS